MTNILTSTVIHGIQQNAAKVVQKCIDSAGSYLDTYVWNLEHSQKPEHNLLILRQTVLHCYALDCASHALFNPSGTKSLDGKEDYILMEDLSYDNRLKSKRCIFFKRFFGN